MHFRQLLATNALIVGTVSIVLYAMGLRVRFSDPVTSAISVSLLSAIYIVYAYVRRDDRIAGLSASILLIACFTHAGAAGTYAAVALGLPLADHQFAAIDAALGFDWQWYFAWSASSPLLASALRAAYNSSLAQIIAACILLAVTGRNVRLAGFLWLFILIGSATTVLSALFPAVGAVIFHNPLPSLRVAIGEDAGVWHITQFQGLRDGTLRVIDFAKVEGVVTFPSFHTSLAVICSWAFWPFRLLRWPLLILNIVVIASTPSIGGHYFIDTIAGGILAWLAILALPRILGSGLVARPTDQRSSASIR